MSTVLVVDDEPDILLMVKHALSLAGYRVLEADSGEAAIEILGREPPDAILLDLRLPGIEGWDVVAWVRDRPDIAATPIVIISAHATPSTRRRAVETGCAGYLTKPFRMDELLRTIDGLVPRP